MKTQRDCPAFFQKHPLARALAARVILSIALQGMRCSRWLGDLGIALAKRE